MSPIDGRIISPSDGTLILIFKVSSMCINSIVISETAKVNGYVVHLLAANDVLNTSIDGKSVLSGC